MEVMENGEIPSHYSGERKLEKGQNYDSKYGLALKEILQKIIDIKRFRKIANKLRCLPLPRVYKKIVQKILL